MISSPLQWRKLLRSTSPAITFSPRQVDARAISIEIRQKLVFAHFKFLFSREVCVDTTKVRMLTRNVQNLNNYTGRFYDGYNSGAPRRHRVNCGTCTNRASICWRGCFFFLFHRLLEIAQEEEEEEDSIPLLLVWRPENVGNVATRRISVFLFYPMANWRFLMERPPFLRLIKWWIGLSRVTYDTRLLSLSGALYGKCYSYF